MEPNKYEPSVCRLGMGNDEIPCCVSFASKIEKIEINLPGSPTLRFCSAQTRFDGLTMLME